MFNGLTARHQVCTSAIEQTVVYSGVVVATEVGVRWTCDLKTQCTSQYDKCVQETGVTGREDIHSMVTPRQPLVRLKVLVRFVKTGNRVHDIHVLCCSECLLDTAITNALIW